MKKEFISPALLSFLFLLLGFSLLHENYVGYGISFFVFLPFVLGYMLGGAKAKSLSLAGFAFSFVIFCLLLIQNQLEGMVCILMSFPLILFAFGCGFIIKVMFFGFSKSTKQEDDIDGDILDDHLLKSSILPFCFFVLLGVVEKELTKNSDTIVAVKSEIILPYSSLNVYEAIKSVDTLDVEKPFLMKLDLPIPEKCILEDEKVGGIRTCYFKGGKIVERITALEKGRLLKMDVIDYELTGRTWLGFKEAIYEFETIDNQHCKMTRITTYTSELFPRNYWQPLEKIGIEQEHQYVFKNLEKDLMRKFGG